MGTPIPFLVLILTTVLATSTPLRSQDMSSGSLPKPSQGLPAHLPETVQHGSIQGLGKLAIMFDAERTPCKSETLPKLQPPGHLRNVYEILKSLLEIVPCLDHSVGNIQDRLKRLDLEHVSKNF